MTEFEMPSSLFSFKLDMVGDETGNRYKGKFLYRRPNVGMRRDISQIESILNQQVCDKYEIKEASPDVRSYNYTLAYLKVCLEECPEWFRESDYGMFLQDENIVNFIAGQIKIFEDKRLVNLNKILATPRTPIEKEVDLEEGGE